MSDPWRTWIRRTVPVVVTIKGTRPGSGASTSVLSGGTSTFVKTTDASTAAITLINNAPLRRLCNGRPRAHSFLVQIDDPIDVEWTPRGNDGRPPAAPVIEQLFESELCFRVHVGGWFVENED